MNISEIGEFGFIERFSKRFGDLMVEGTTGIGDDCAIMPLDANHDQVVTTDLLVEDIHFIKSAIPPFQLGHKSLAVNLSDIAAMGAQPTASFLSLAIPKNMEVEYLDAFMEGYYRLSKKYGVPLMGGDTTRSADRLVINVCVTGKVPKDQSRLRSMARPGDVIAVTGHLGDSAGGLQMLLEKHEIDPVSQPLIDWHNQPEPAIKEGLWLARQPGVHAMMDISDGIASDLNHILKSSRVAGTIELNALPLSDALRTASNKFGWNALELAASGGEDYHLLVTVARKEWKKTEREFRTIFNKPLYTIGLLTGGNSGIRWTMDGKEVKLGKEGFRHF